LMRRIILKISAAVNASCAGVVGGTAADDVVDVAVADEAAVSTAVTMGDARTSAFPFVTVAVGKSGAGLPAGAQWRSDLHRMGSRKERDGVAASEAPMAGAANVREDEEDEGEAAAAALAPAPEDDDDEEEEGKALL